VQAAPAPEPIRSAQTQTPVVNQRAPYDYLEIGRSALTMEGVDATASGGYLHASLFFGKQGGFHLFSSYEQIDFLTWREFGMGVSSRRDVSLWLMADFSIQNWELDLPLDLGTYSRDMNKLTLELHGKPAPQWELWGGIGRLWTRNNNKEYFGNTLIYDDSASTDTVNIGVQFLPIPALGILLEYETINEFYFTKLGLRWYTP